MLSHYLIHVMIYIITFISYIYLNKINIKPLTMCHLLIKIICCNKSLTDKDVVYEPENISVPFEDVKKVGSAIEQVVEDFTHPEQKVKNIINLFDKNSSKEKIT